MDNEQIKADIKTWQERADNLITRVSYSPKNRIEELQGLFNEARTLLLRANLSL